MGLMGLMGRVVRLVPSVRSDPAPLADTPIRPYAVTHLSRRHQGGIYLLVEADACDQDLVSADLGDLTGDGL